MNDSLAGDLPVHVAHLVYGLEHGGLEKVVWQLVNYLQPPYYRHSILCLTSCDRTPHRLPPGVALYSLNKQAGQDWGLYVRLWRLLRRLRPQVVHTCNLAACEGLVVAFLAGVRGRLHVEHGRDSYDLTGSVVKYRLLRRFTTLFAHTVVGVSSELTDWLVHQVGIPAGKVVQVTNGVDTEEFYPSSQPVAGFTVGFVGRLWPVKDPAILVRAMALWRQSHPRETICLQVVGDGPLRGEMERLALHMGVAADIQWLGWQDNVAERMRQWHLLVLPSLAEGTPLTLLEAMASGLPVVASCVGGIPAVVFPGRNGMLISSGDAAGLADAMDYYRSHPEEARCHGREGREWVVANHSLVGMVGHYDRLFRRCGVSCKR